MIFDTRTMNCIKSWGVNGRGPGEYGLFTHLIRLPGNEFFVADFSQYNIQTYTIPEFRLVSDVPITNKRNDRVMKEIPQRIVSPDGELFFYDKTMLHELKLTRWKNGSEPVEIFHFESFKERFKDKDSFTYSGRIGVNGKLKRIVYAYRYFRRFDIFDYDGNVFKQVEILPTVTQPSFVDGKNLDYESTVRCFWSVRTTENSIYLYYIGYTSPDLKKMKWNAETYIEEYTWNGKPVNRYRLNRYISDFDILYDKDGSMVFVGIEEYNEHPLIFLRENN